MAKTMRAGVPLAKIEEMKRTMGAERIEEALALLEKKKRESVPLAYLRHPSAVYYMRMDRLVKIGVTTNICSRVHTIMPQGVLAIEWGDVHRERQRHAEFDDFHSHLEWYWIKPRLWNHIARLREEFEEREGKTIEQWLDEHYVLDRSGALLDQPGQLGFT